MEKSGKNDLGDVQVHQKVFAEIILSAINEIDGVQLIQKNIGNRLFEIFGIYISSASSIWERLGYRSGESR